MGASIGVHVWLLLWIADGAVQPAPSDYDQIIKPRETHLVWYSFKQKLPDVSPARATPDTRPLRAEKLEKQVMISAPQDAPRADQMVFHPAPQVKIVPPAPLPNIIALAAPPPPQKQFVPPRPAKQPELQAKVADVTPAPELQTAAKPLDLFHMPKVSRPFVAPVEHRIKVESKVQLSDAPELKARVTDGVAAKVLDQGARTMAFRPQPARTSTASVGVLPDAPVVPGAAPANANVAVVGLNAIDKLNVPLPSGSRPAQFSAGPKLNPDGATAAGTSSGITVPDLFVRGGDNAATRLLLAHNKSPASLDALHDLARDGNPEAAAHGGGIPVSGAPDPRFLGRQVFSVAIQSPNLTSRSGSWLMWYADRAELPYRALIYAPQPVHEVDPKYIATAVEERVEGTVRLAFVIGQNGRVTGVELVKGVDDRLDQSAMEALRKWQFTPALREGKPVDVDALVEIPFRLSPLQK